MGFLIAKTLKGTRIIRAGGDFLEEKEIRIVGPLPVNFGCGLFCYLQSSRRGLSDVPSFCELTTVR
jgi:hypothetical protein